MTRVLFVNTRSAIGADVAVHLTLIRNLDPARCRITVATNNRAVDFTRMCAILRAVPGVRIVPMNLGYELSGRSRAGKLLGTAGNLCALAWGLLRLAWLVRARGIDVIHSTDRPRDALVGTLLARLTRRRNLVHVHIKWYPDMGRATTWALAHCDGVLAISQFVRRSLIEGRIDEHKVYTALNSTDTAEFEPATARPGAFRKSEGIPANVPLVGIVARIMLWKGQLELVNAMARVREQIPDARLAIIGNEDLLAAVSPESYTAKVRARIEELGLADSVTWAGWHDDMPSVYADLDVVAVPSWEEPFGLVVTEAMAMERAVVGFDSGALPEIITSGEDGILVPARDTGKLAAALVDLLQNTALRQELGRAGRRTVMARFTPRRQADEVADIYEQMKSCRKEATAVSAVNERKCR